MLKLGHIMKLTEQDISTKFIIPALTDAGWNLQTQIREQVYFTDGRITIRGKSITRGEKKRADIVLYYKNELPLAIIETKDKTHSVGDGMQQGLNYAEILDIPFVYSSNGEGFLEHDRTVKTGSIEKELGLNAFPNPEQLYQRYKEAQGVTKEVESIINQDYHQQAGGKSPRYFQRIAINRTVEAVAKGQKRLLLVMATGTGKTYTAFQIIWRLWKSKTKKRILFLVDRNILANQTINNDFIPFDDKMVKIEHRNVDKAYEIYLALYQGLTGSEEESNIFKQFSPDFFDLIIVDECHRGSAKDNSAWREILDYYKDATQIGLTATPKETKDITTQGYFGKPIYTYSLKQGIDDGFLAPYKVVRITLDRDVEGYRPEIGKTDKFGNEVPDRIYNTKDFDRNLVIDERTKLVARKMTEYMKETDRMQKAIVFCVDIDHAERIRQALVNENSDKVAENRRYVVRITGDNDEGKKELDNFIDPESSYPVIATTSKLMTTGVDAQTCQLIVLDTNINSITEFKQIIGRGTRIREDYHKFFFTILDFRNATELFADPDFDGPPLVVYQPKEGEPIAPPITDEDVAENEVIGKVGKSKVAILDDTPEGPKKYYVIGVPVKVINQRVQYMDANGKLITESLKDYSKKNILSEYASLDEFLTAWTNAEKKEAIIGELESRGVIFEELKKDAGKDLDPFDLVCHIAFGKKPLTRQERADNVKKQNYFAKYEGKAREVIDALIEKYADAGITAIDSIDDLQVSPFTKFGTPFEIVNVIFGGREKYLTAVKEIEISLYKV